MLAPVVRLTVSCRAALHLPQVVSLSSPICNMTIRDSHFRSRYGAVVLAVHRNGERIAGGHRDNFVNVRALPA